MLCGDAAHRIDDTELPAADVMRDVFAQYAELIRRARRASDKAPRQARHEKGLVDLGR